MPSQTTSKTPTLLKCTLIKKTIKKRRRRGDNPNGYTSVGWEIWENTSALQTKIRKLNEQREKEALKYKNK